MVLGLSSGYALLFGASASTSPIEIATSANGIGWSNPIAGPTTSAITLSSAVSVGNTVSFATETGARGLLELHIPVHDGKPRGGHRLQPLGVALRQRRSIDQRTNRRSVDHGDLPQHRRGLVTHERGRRELVDTAAGDSDNASRVIVSGSLQGDYDYVQSVVATTDVAWVTGTSAPYSIWFPAFPVVVPSAATTSDPWAVGLLAIRVVLLAAERVRLTGERAARGEPDRPHHPWQKPGALHDEGLQHPSAFVGTADAKMPYEYDNYTLSDLGIGWELGLPVDRGELLPSGRRRLDTALVQQHQHHGVSRGGQLRPLQERERHLHALHGGRDEVRLRRSAPDLHNIARLSLRHAHLHLQ